MKLTSKESDTLNKKVDKASNTLKTRNKIQKLCIKQPKTMLHKLYIMPKIILQVKRIRQKNILILQNKLL